MGVDEARGEQPAGQVDHLHRPVRALEQGTLGVGSGGDSDDPVTLHEDGALAAVSVTVEEAAAPEQDAHGSFLPGRGRGEKTTDSAT